ncbi:phytoene/squalene synthase family protein [Cognatilysobacter bugurensis]|uniref:Phytoene synthase n=1 Tax=Cognatilysobacter bugurensis TaxID=543356 RepID=A0A918W7T6_9GAMM|nr:phytoene/squalene synthase family protein [Lysobacter bugurensis]GHA73663.1 phytoene synthase [Lysobacter bugurensis]
MTDEDIPATASDELEGFVGKWRARWPEWPLAEVFVQREQRPVALAWAALQQELLDAAWGGSDARPGELKLAWWMEELAGWGQGRRRHPLGRVLQREPAPWPVLAAALPALARSRERPLDADDAFAAVEPAAIAAAQVEHALFGAGDSDGTSRLIAASWLAARARGEGDAAVPLALLGANGDSAAAQNAWRGQLAARWPQMHRGAPRVRRLWASLARLRLTDSRDTPLPAPRVLWDAWRAARN